MEVDQNEDREETKQSEDQIVNELLEGHERALDRHKVGLEAKMWMQQAHTKGRKSKKVEFKMLEDKVSGDVREERSDGPPVLASNLPHHSRRTNNRSLK